MKAKIVAIFILCIAFPAFGEPTLEQQVEKLREGANETIAVRPMTFEEAAEFQSGAAPVSVVIRGQLESTLGGTVFILKPLDGESMKRIPAILSDPSDPAQQATFRLGDRMEATGVLTTYERNKLPKFVTAQLEGLDLSAYNRQPVMVVTRLVSAAPAEEAGAGAIAPPAAAPPPDAEETPEASPLETPAPGVTEPTTPPTTQPDTAQTQTLQTQTQRAPAPAPTIIVEPVPVYQAEFVANPLDMVENPENYYGRTLVFDAITDDTPDEYLVHLIFDEDSPDDYVLAVRTDPTPVLNPGTRVRVSGSLTTLPLEEIEERAGIAIGNILWADEDDVPKFLVSSLDVVMSDRTNGLTD